MKKSCLMTLIVSFFVGSFLLASCSFDSNPSDVIIIDDSEVIASLFNDYVGNTYTTEYGDSLTLSEDDSGIYYEYAYSYTYDGILYEGTSTSGYLVTYVEDSNTDGDTVYMGLVKADYHENAYGYSYPSYTQETYNSAVTDRDCYVPVMFELISSDEIKFSEYYTTFDNDDNGYAVTCFDTEVYGKEYLPYDKGTYNLSSDATLVTD